MRLNEGKIGKQESVSLIAIAMVAATTYLLDSEKAYSKGNSTFISLVLSIVISAAAFILVWYAMKRTGARDLNDLFDRCAGKVAGSVLSAMACMVFLLYAYRLTAKFCVVIHSSVFSFAQYESVAMWIIVPIAFAAISGFECIGRLAKILGVLLGVLMLFGFATMISSFDLTRLAPFPGSIEKTATDTVARSADSIAAFLGILCVAPAMQGVENVRKNGLLGAAIAAVFVFIIQFALGITFTYTDLADMTMPLYMLKMVVMRESYLFRLDQMNLFFYMITAVISAAFFLYATALMLTRRTEGEDVRPAVVSISALILAALRVDHRFVSGIIQRIVDFSYDYAYVIWAPFIIAAVIGIIRTMAKQKRRKADETRA